jgi:hypothetical protein
MSRLARRNVPATTFTITRTQRIAIIALGIVLALSGVALSTSAALREKLGLSARSKTAPVEQSSLSPAARKMAARDKADLLRFMGVSKAPGRTVNPSAPAVPTVSATKTDSLAIDNDSDLQADPGDTIKYTVNINASGEDATGVTFTDTVDPNTAFVPGSLRATPVAVDDNYSATGNIRITVAAPGVLGNDFVGIPSATITGAPATSANGGDVTVNADGSFTYNPPAGFEGTDTFTYTLTNSEGSNSATVTINVSGMIWFINNTASCPCDGRLTNPFNSLASFQAVNDGVGNHPAANDNIFVYESAIDYVGPVILLNGQRFLGQDSTASLSAMTGLTPPVGSDPLPATNSGNGVIVNITTGNAITVGSGNTLRGFTGGDSTTDITGSAFGTLTISDVTLNGNGQALNLTNGTLAATFGSISSTNSGTTGISLSGVAGNLTSPTTTVNNPTGIGISVGTSSATLDFGNTTAAGSGGTGVSLLTNSGTITFGALNISPDASQRGLLATDNSNTITTTSGAITNTGATAVEITRAIGTTPLVVSLTSVSSDGGVNGIKLNNVNGSFTVTGTGTTAGTGGTIQNKTSNGVEVTNATNITLTNMNLPNNAQTQTVAGNSAQCGGNLTTGNNLSCVAGIYLSGVVGVTLTNVSVTGSSQMGINGNNVTTFTMSNSTITGNGNEALEDGLTFQNLKGTCSITDSMIKDNAARQIVVSNIQNSSTLTLGITGTRTNNVYPLVDSSTTEIGKTIQTNVFTDQSILVNSVSTATNVNIALNLTGVVFKNSLPGNSVLINAVAGTGTLGGATTNCSFDNTAGGVILQAQNGMSGDYDVTNSEFNKVNLQSILYAGLSPYNGALTGRATGNHVGEDSTGTAGAACEPSPGNCNGIQVNLVAGTGSGSITTRIENNAIQQVSGAGILVAANGTGSPDVNVNIANNTVTNPAGLNALGIQTNIGTTTGANVDGCLGITGNTVTGTYSAPLGTQQGISTRVRFNSHHALPGYGGSDTAVGAPGNAVTDFIIGNNSAGSKVFTQRSNAGNYPGGAACTDPPAMVAPDSFSSSNKESSIVNGDPIDRAPADTVTEDILYVVNGPGVDQQDAPRLQAEWLTSTVLPAAIARWKKAGISAEDLARLQAVTYEVADLPDGQLATTNSTHLKIDATAAGYGWYIDQTLMDDDEFDVPVPDRELQTTEYSLAHDRGVDVLTVVMRQLGTVYLQGKDGIQKQLGPLMQNTLSPDVRRLPDSQSIQSRRSPAGVSRANQPGKEKSFADRAGKASALRARTGASAHASVRNAHIDPVAERASRQTGRLSNHASRNRTRAATLSSTLADVMLNIGTLPAGEGVTITFNVTVDDPFTGASPQVSNQGTVSGSNFADVLTDDPTVGGAADPTVTPIDLPDVSVAVSPTSVQEDGVTNLVYTFTRTGSTANPMTVNFSVGGSASFTEPDYTQTGAATFTATSGTVVIPSGSSTATVTVDPSLDLTVEPDETVDLTVTSGVGYTIGSPNAASGTIVNDDTTVSVAVSPGSVTEDGATNLVYTFTRVGVTSVPLSVNFNIGGTATFGVSPNDYTQTGAILFSPPAGVVSFTAGSSTAIVTIDPEADSTVELDETVDLTVVAGIGYTVGAPSSASGTITNDDTDVSVAVSPGSVAEDGATNLVYTFTRAGVTTNSLTVNFSVGGSATFGVSPNDYTQTGATSFTPPTGTVTFGPGSSTAMVTIDPEADSTVEPNETVDLTVTAGAGYNIGAPSSASGTITNDDTDVTVAVSPGSVAEDGATNLVYTFSRTGVTAGALTVNFSVGGTATFGVSPDDYTQTGATTFTTTSGSVTFTPGNSTAAVTVNPETDSTVEPDETVDLTLTAGAGYNVGAPSSASGTIVNDDTDVSVAVSPAAVAEDGATNLLYTFTRNGVTSGALTVNFSVGGTASFGASPNDYTQTGATTFTTTTGSVTFTPGNSTATVTVNPETDTTIEADETVSLALTGGAGYNVSSPSSATGTITNDDADVSVAVAPAAVTEDGATNLVYTFTRTGFTGGALTVNFSVGGTATFGPTPDDYTQTGATTFSTTTGSVTFAPGSPTAAVTVNPETDLTAEADETVTITLTAGASYNVVIPNSATGTILNDDTLVSVVASPSSTAEGGANMVYTFTRTGPTTSALSVNFSVGGSASFPGDYSQSGATTFTPPTATVTFGVGNATATVTVTPLTDCFVEGSETVEFTVQPGAGYGVGSPNMATGTITNTPDSSAPTITLIPNVNMTLWPPNHQYESVAVTDFVASASDNCDPSVNLNSVYILKITSDEVENGNGDGNTLNDIVIGATCKTAQLRSERQGNGDGRVYTITFKVKDSVGNFTTATATVTVRKNPNTPAVDSGTQYTVNSACP